MLHERETPVHEFGQDHDALRTEVLDELQRISTLDLEERAAAYSQVLDSLTGMLHSTGEHA